MRTNELLAMSCSSLHLLHAPRDILNDCTVYSCKGSSSTADEMIQTLTAASTASFPCNPCVFEMSQHGSGSIAIVRH
jgi:hypothetical protein